MFDKLANLPIIDGHTKLPNFWELKTRFNNTTPEWTWYFIASGALPPSEEIEVFTTAELIEPNPSFFPNFW